MENGLSEQSPGVVRDRDWPADGLEAVDQCPVCGARERSPAVTDMLDGFFSAPGRWTLQRCGKCASGYLDPRPTPATIGVAYAGYYTHQATRPSIRSGLVRRIYFAIVDLYVKGRYLPASPLATAIAAGIRIFAYPVANRQDSRHRWLDRFRPGASLLDAGCGNGSFLKIARGLGWTVEGFDLDEQAVETARGAGVRAHVGVMATLEGVLQGPYDAITMNHVVEHLYDPKRDLERAYQRLKPGGLLFLETPNIDALNLQIFGMHWRGLEAPRHLVLFSPASLAGLLTTLGFVDIKFRRHVAFSGMYEASSQAEAAFQRAEHPRRASLWDRLRGNLASKERLEFITLTARRPAD